MNVNDFGGTLHKIAELFVRYWNEKHQSDPNNFPQDLDEQEWWEQYYAWLETTEYQGW